MIYRASFTRKLLLVVILLLAFYMRLYKLEGAPVRWDEAYSVWVARMDLPVGTAFTARDVHPPVYYWLLYVWVRLAGSSEFAIRVLSVFPSLVSIAAVYIITVALSRDKLAAILAILLIMLSPYHIHWSQDARMYGLAAMFAGLTIYAHLRIQPLLLALSGIGAALTHYFGAIVVGIAVLHDAIFRRDIGRKRRQWSMAIGITAAVCIIWSVYAVGHIRRDPSLATFDPAAAFLIMANVFAVNDFVSGFYSGHALLINLIFFAGLYLSWRDNRRATSFIVLGCLLPPTVIALLGLPIVPVHVNALQERYYYVFAPIVYAGLGLGLAAMLRNRRLRPAGAIIAVALLVFHGSLVQERAEKRYVRDDYRSMMAAIATLSTDDDRVYFTSGGRKPQVYYHLDRVGYDVPKNVYAEPLNVFGIPRAVADVDAMMDRTFNGITRFWLIEIEAHLDEPLDARVNWINKRYHRIFHNPVGWNGFSLYSADPSDALPDITTIIPPVITEARPADQVRIGVPGGTRVDLIHSGQVIDSMLAETWMLHQFDIFAFYFNGLYELRVGDQRYPFIITHSQDFPGGT